jgi:GNAT superfamily N-acetyltransferase
MTAISIRTLDAAETQSRLTELAHILVDAVAHGASVNFMAGFAHEAAQTFWHNQIEGIANNEKQLLVADNGKNLVATAMLIFAPQPNAPHRAEIGKMLVHSSVRRQGVGRRLLTAAEQAARSAGRTLLMLDTETGSAGDKLYRSCGWIPVGGIPDHAFRPDGRLAETTVFYKTLGPHPPAATR